MKTRNIIMAFLALMAVGCAKEQPAGENVAPAAGRTIEVNMPEATKVALGEGTETAVSLVWSEGDEIAVIENKGEASQKVSTYRLIGEGGTTSGTFEYVEGDALSEVITDVVFPAKSATSGVMAHDIQTYVENNVDNNAMIMSWTRTSPDEAIVLSHKASVLKFALTGTDQEITSVQVTCNNETFKLNCENPVALSSTETMFYVAVPGSTESLDYTVCFNTSNGVPMIKSFTKALGAGKIGRLPALAFTPFHNLKLGDVYGGGLVFEMNGKDIKVISLDGASAIAWATAADAVVRIDDKDLESGEEKAELFRALGADLGGYPAAEWCINKGEGWYLPSLQEISAFKKNLGTSDEATQTAINNTLAEYNGTAISFSGKYYWACEEYSDGNKARCYNLKSGGQKTTKTTTSNRPVRAVKRITLAGGENPDPKPEAPDTPADSKPGLGDIYEGGLVFEIGVDYVKIISIDAPDTEDQKLKWATDNSYTISLQSAAQDTGEAKDKEFRALSETELSKFPAAEWCIKKGEGWYLPSQMEIRALNTNLDINSSKTEAQEGTNVTQNTINQKVTAAGGTAFKFGEFHWCCEEHASDATKARYTRPCDANATAGKGTGPKATGRYVRAVKKITFAN